MVNTAIKIAGMAKEFDVTFRTLRYYEDIQLLNPDRVGVTRFYTDSDVYAMGMIQSMKDVGIKLREIKKVMNSDEGPRGLNERQELTNELILKRTDTYVQDLKRKIKLANTTKKRATGGFRGFVYPI